MKRMLVLLCFLSFSPDASGQSGPAHPGWNPFRRDQDGRNRDVFVMTLGEVSSSLADGTFDPNKDEVRMNDGSVKQNYYKQTLGIKYFQPIDKARFPLRPQVGVPGISIIRRSTKMR